MVALVSKSFFFAVFSMNAVTFISFDSISGLNTAKIVKCSQIVPVYPKFVSIQLN